MKPRHREMIREGTIYTHNLADLQSATLKNVLLDPRRIVPPICVLEP